MKHDDHAIPCDQDLWVFGYGSLMWNPGFPHVDVQPARLHGHHRSLCVYSWVHRGTRHRPGLVLGLDRGGACQGRAFRVEAANVPAAVDYLYARELVTHVYRPVMSRVHFGNGERTDALCFVVDRDHEQYAGRLDVEQAAALVASATGQSGPNPEYLHNTVRHLHELGLSDPYLEAVLSRFTTPP